MHNLIRQAHPEWHDLLNQSLKVMDPKYLENLQSSDDWFPGKSAIFAAFSLPLSATQYILIGESPYPRSQSANGYAFWDNSVHSLWSASGFSKEVNRATSLRNLLKMMLHARGDLIDDFSQNAIARLDKSNYIQTAEQLFTAFMKKGILLLNASLVFSAGKVPYHARHWRLFIEALFNQLAKRNHPLKLILLGRIAEKIPETPMKKALLAEHPYNISFITNKKVIAFFKPIDLIAAESENEK